MLKMLQLAFTLLLLLASQPASLGERKRTRRTNTNTHRWMVEWSGSRFVPLQSPRG